MGSNPEFEAKLAGLQHRLGSVEAQAAAVDLDAADHAAAASKPASELAAAGP